MTASHSSGHHISLGDLLSPRLSKDSDILGRPSGRFGYQMCSEAIAFSQNLPQRLLLVDQLKALPTVIHGLLGKADIQNIVRQEVPSICNEIAPIFNAELKKVQVWTQASTRVLLRMAKVAWRSVSPDACTGQWMNSNEKTFLINVIKSAALPSGWFQVLAVLLPHIEQKIWLTDIGAPLPGHAVTRMHDPWSLFILLWCYRYWTHLEDSQPSTGDSVPRFPAFYATFLEIAVVAQWTDVPCQGPAGMHRVAVVLGPIFKSSSPQDDDKPHFKMARFFQKYLRLASEHIAEWCSVDDATPSTEELMDAYQARFALDDTEFNLRAANVKRAWACLRSIQVPANFSLSRLDWEACALLAVWAARWDDDVKKLGTANPPWKLTVPGWDKTLEYTPSTQQKPTPGLFLSTQKQSDLVCVSMARAKQKLHYLDVPSVTWNRFRERQAASWSAQIAAVTSLMQRMSTRIEAVSTDRLGWRSPDYLRGFGGRLCRHIALISQAHGVCLYWYDFAQSPPRLRVLESYAKPYEHRSKREDIHQHFDAQAYQAADPHAPCHLRDKSPSIAYRCAALNRYCLEEDIQAKGDRAMLDAFADYKVAVPRSKMAIPIRMHGRVIGVIELFGFAPKQFNKELRAPLRRISSLIGPALYETVLLHQFQAIDDWVVQLPPGLIEQENSNPLMQLSRLLCNVFLCPMVHIWTIPGDTRFYKLLGSSDPAIFEQAGEVIHGIKLAPRFKIDMSVPEENHANRPVAELAVALWGAYRHDDPADWPKVPKAFHGSDGLMVKGLYRKNQSTQYYGDLTRLYQLDNGERVRQALLAATGKGILLGDDFVNSSALPYRKWLFDTRAGGGLADVAAFAMVLKSAPETHHAFGQEPSDLARKVVGVVTLHDHGDSWHQTHDLNKAPVKQQPDQATRISGFGSGWVPVAAHMQEHLPAVFQQIRLLKDPYNLMRSQIIHEAGHEIKITFGVVRKLDQRLHFALKGGGYESLRKMLDRLHNGTAVDAQEVEACQALLDCLEGTAKSADYLNVLRQQQRLERLHARLTGGEAFMDLKLPSGEAQQLLPLRQWLYDKLEAYRTNNERNKRVTNWRRVITTSVVGRSDSLRWVYAAWDQPGPHIMVVLPIFDHVVTNLLDNMDKYTIDSSAWVIELNPHQRLLSFANLGAFHPEDDSVSHHLIYGGRGSAAAGKGGSGLGLPIAREAAGLLGIEMKYLIEPIPVDHAKPSTARYLVTLDLENVWHSSRS